jgi:hypothetical protein
MCGELNSSYTQDNKHCKQPVQLAMLTKVQEIQEISGDNFLFSDPQEVISSFRYLWPCHQFSTFLHFLPMTRGSTLTWATIPYIITNVPNIKFYFYMVNVVWFVCFGSRMDSSVSLFHMWTFSPYFENTRACVFNKLS